ncbi:carboxymuconolactone decarboxylase family protein [Magnetovibrio sp. PR-2]|uniref:carboxymuconolactone decarboxylase family protein n=1 Tax=Magnetovibrio sp. PR-2 TaxID=3120356 RepID=UPI002FCDFA63
MSLFPLNTRETAPQGSHAVMDAYVERFGFVPNLIGILSSSPAATQGYAQTYGLLGETAFSLAEQQLLFLTVSRENGCQYCVAAHTMAGRMAGLDEDSLNAVRNSQPLLDPKLAALSDFAVKVVNKRGQLNHDDVHDFLAAGYTQAQILDVLLGVATKTISNYMNHIAETPLDPQFAKDAWEPRVSSAA